MESYFFTWLTGKLQRCFSCIICQWFLTFSFEVVSLSGKQTTPKHSHAPNSYYLIKELWKFTFKLKNHLAIWKSNPNLSLLWNVGFHSEFSGNSFYPFFIHFGQGPYWPNMSKVLLYLNGILNTIAQVILSFLL